MWRKSAMDRARVVTFTQWREADAALQRRPLTVLMNVWSDNLASYPVTQAVRDKEMTNFLSVIVKFIPTISSCYHT
jgi:hypothetical protein